MRVYRVEVALEEKRVGMYRAGGIPDALFCSFSCPPPFDEYGEPELAYLFRSHDSDTTRSFFFGFKNIKQLDDWLDSGDNGVMEWLLKRRAFLVVYDVPEKDVVLGRKQLVFKKERATELKATAFDWVFADIQIAV